MRCSYRDATGQKSQRPSRHGAESGFASWSTTDLSSRFEAHILGLEGVGKAALYRLTDCAYAGAGSATYDFQSWDGVLFDEENQTPA